jgi:CheY-like chemotaxis protein
MPRLDGLGATRAIRALPGWAGRPIVALTANAFSEDRGACEAAGMNDFIAKPIDLQALYETLLRWLPAAPAPAVPQPVPAPALDAAALQRLVSQLDGLLSMDDFDAIVLFERHAELLRLAFGAPCDELARRIRRFDFEAACSLLRCGDFALPRQA